jgi:hypothetical protein
LDKSQDYPGLTDLNWLNDLMFFTDFAAIYNNLNKKTPRPRSVLTIFHKNKIFEKKIEIFCKYLQNENLKYFPHLKKQLIITK